MEEYFGNIIKVYEKVLNEEIGDGKLKTKLVDNLKYVLNVELVNTVLKEYKKGMLIKELGDGELKKRILNKLEETLLGKHQDNIQDDFLDTKINSDEIQRMYENENNYFEIGVRTYNGLRFGDMETYRDLVKFCYRKRKNKLSKENYLTPLLKLRNLGKASKNEVMEHLESINFDFSHEYAKKVVEQSKM